MCCADLQVQQMQLKKQEAAASAQDTSGRSHRKYKFISQVNSEVRGTFASRFVMCGRINDGLLFAGCRRCSRVVLPASQRAGSAQLLLRHAGACHLISISSRSACPGAGLH